MNVHQRFNPGRRHLLWATSSMGLAGCSGLLPKPPEAPARHLLDAGAPSIVATTTSTTTTTTTTPSAAAATAARPVQRPAAGAQTLMVALPRAAPGYGSARMLYLQREHELQAFAYNEWVDSPAQMLAPLLVRSLQGSGTFAVVLLAPTAAVAGLRLETEIIRLHQDFSTRPSQLRLTMRAVLLDTRARQAIAWREFDDSAATGSDDPLGGVRAAQQAVQRVLAALTAWSAEAATAAAAAGAAPVRR